MECTKGCDNCQEWAREVEMSEKESDFSVENEGIIFLLTANNDAAGEWLEEKVPPDAL